MLAEFTTRGTSLESTGWTQEVNNHPVYTIRTCDRDCEDGKRFIWQGCDDLTRHLAKETGRNKAEPVHIKHPAVSDNQIATYTRGR